MRCKLREGLYNPLSFSSTFSTFLQLGYPYQRNIIIVIARFFGEEKK